MSSFTLVEVVPRDFAVERGERVVALGARAADELERRGVPFAPLEDFYSESHLLADQGSHWERQMDWLARLDRELRSFIPELARSEAELAALYGRWLKRCLDTVLIRGRQIESLLANARAGDTVRLVTHPRRNADPPANLTFVPGDGAFRNLVPIFAAARGLETDILETKPSAAAPGRALPALKGRVRERLERIRLLAAARRGSGSGRLTLLLLYRRYDLVDLAEAALAQGDRVLILDGDGVTPLGRLGPSWSADSRVPAHRDPEWAHAARELTADDSPLWEWPRTWFGASPVPVLARRVGHWIERVAPEISGWADSFRGFFAGRQVDFVVAPFLDALRDFGAMEGARMAGVPRASIEHGDGPFSSEARDHSNLIGVDHHFAPDRETATHVASRRELVRCPSVVVHCGSYRRRRDAGLASARAEERRRPAGPPTAVYALTAMGYDARYLNQLFYPDIWYFDLVRTMVAALAEADGYRVIVKLFPKDPENPVEQWVGELGAPNVEASRRPLREWLVTADRLITDLPSTAVYEAASAGIPALHLIHESFPCRSGALERFGSSVARFSTHGEAKSAARAFLDDPEPAAVRFDPECDDILATLREIRVRAVVARPES